MNLDKLNSDDRERRTHLIYSYYRNGVDNMPRSELAERCGYSIEYISRLFSGKKRVTDEAARCLAKVLHVREEYLLCKDNFMLEEDYQKEMEEVRALGFLINKIVIDQGFINTDIPITTLSKTQTKNKNMLSFIKKSQNMGKRLLINIEDNEYIELQDKTYRNLCKDIADFIEYRIKQLYKNYNHYDISNE